MRTLMLTLAVTATLAACSKSDPGTDSAATPAPATARPAAAVGPFSATGLEALDRYEQLARDHATAIEKAAPADLLVAQSEELVAIAAEVLPEFLSARPDCRAYLETALALKDTWTTLTAEQIEAGYHKDGALPKVANGAACYHMKDLIVHPITAQVLLAEDPEGNRAEARHEIDEVVAHVAVVKATR